MPLSINLHVKCPFYKKWNKKKTPIFFSWNFHTVFREQIVIFYQIFKSGSSKFFFKCPQFTKVSWKKEQLCQEQLNLDCPHKIWSTSIRCQPIGNGGQLLTEVSSLPLPGYPLLVHPQLHTISMFKQCLYIRFGGTRNSETSLKYNTGSLNSNTQSLWITIPLRFL